MSVYIVVWCNGNTTDFGSVFQGSNPCATTGSYSLMEKHFATDKKSWGSSPYRTSRLRYSSGVEHLIHIQVVGGSNPPIATNMVDVA